MKLRSRATRLAAGLVPAGVVLAAATGTASAATPADLPQQQIAAVAEAGTVYVSGSWSGYVDYGDASWSPLIQANFSCSGFVASSDGYVVTAGHCADPAEGKKMLVDEFLTEAISAGVLTSSDAQDLLASGAEDAFRVEGKQAGSPPVLTAKVFPATAIGGTGNFQGYDATVVDDRPLAQGDVALLKADPPTPLPVLEVAGTQPAAGDTIDAIGYPGNVTALVTDRVQPTFAKGQVSGRQQTSGGPFTQVGVSMSPGMSGGPVVNGQGQVIGTVSFGPSDDTQQLNFASTLDTVQALLNRNGVKTGLTPVDRQYRKGLAEYFAGQFHAAAADLTAVVSSSPNQALAQQYKAKAIEQEPTEKLAPAAAPAVKKSSSGLILVIGCAAGGVLLLGGAVAVLLRRRGGGSAPAAPVTRTPVPTVGPQPYPAAPQADARPAAPAAPAPAWPPAPAADLTGHPESAAVPAATAVLDRTEPAGYCQRCGSPHPAQARFCATCGTPFTD